MSSGVRPHICPGCPLWATLVTSPREWGKRVGTDSSLSRALPAPAAVYLPVTNIPGGMVRSTKAKKTTARGGHWVLRLPELLVARPSFSQRSLPPLQGLQATLPGPKPPGSLFLVPLPAAATKLTPSGLAYGASLQIWALPMAASPLLCTGPPSPPCPPLF